MKKKDQAMGLKAHRPAGPTPNMLSVNLVCNFNFRSKMRKHHVHANSGKAHRHELVLIFVKQDAGKADFATFVRSLSSRKWSTFSDTGFPGALLLTSRLNSY